MVAGEKCRPSLGGFLFLICTGLLLALVGGFFTWIMWRSFSRAQEMRSWPVVEAVILRSEIEERKIGEAVPIDYRALLEYDYVYGEKNYTGRNFTLRNNPWSKKRDKAEAVVEKFSEGDVVNAYINPDDPQVSVLKFDTKAPGYSIWFPILFVVGGLGMSGAAVWSLAGGRDEV